MIIEAKIGQPNDTANTLSTGDPGRARGTRSDGAPLVWPPLEPASPASRLRPVGVDLRLVHFWHDSERSGIDLNATQLKAVCAQSIARV